MHNKKLPLLQTTLACDSPLVSNLIIAPSSHVPYRLCKNVVFTAFFFSHFYCKNLAINAISLDFLTLLKGNSLLSLTRVSPFSFFSIHCGACLILALSVYTLQRHCFLLSFPHIILSHILIVFNYWCYCFIHVYYCHCTIWLLCIAKRALLG